MSREQVPLQSNILRTEARPAAWEELFGSEKMALRDAITIMKEAVTRVPPVSSQAASRPRSWLQEDRHSQAAFLSGGRGSGKSTVFLSLVRDCDPLWEGDRTSYPTTVEKGASQIAKDDVGHAKLVKQMVEFVRKRSVWLRPLDMDETNTSTNLLASIVVRIEDACEQWFTPGRRDGCEPGRIGLLESEESDPLQLLRQLSANVAIGWDDDLTSRRQSLDPDNFAAEAMRVERAKLTLISDLGWVLDRLAGKLQRTGGIDNPLFVLPVDDCDMNPTAVLKLLRLLRMIWLPRMFFLVLGDMGMASVLLDMKVSDDIAAVAQKAAKVEILSTNHEVIAGIAGEVAAHAFRKLVPPTQRMFLTYPSIEESLNLRPLGSAKDALRLHELLAQFSFKVQVQNGGGDPLANRSRGTHPAETVQYLVGADPVAVSPAESVAICPAEPVPEFAAENIVDSERDMAERGHEATLLDLLLKPGFEIIKRQEGESLGDCRTPEPEKIDQLLRRSFYSAKSLFEGPVRRSADLWHALERITEGATSWSAESGLSTTVRRVGQDSEREIPTRMHKWLRWIVSQQCIRSILEEPVLAPIDRRSISDAVQPRPDEEWNLTNVPISVTTEAASVVTPEHIAMKIPAKKSGGDAEQSGGDNNVLVRHSFSHVKRWVLEPRHHRVDEKGKSDLPRRRPFSKSTTGMIILFHDLVYEAPWQSGRGSLLADNKIATQRWATTEIHFRGLKVIQPWPAVSYATFWAMDQFIYTWNSLVTHEGFTSLTSPSKQLEMAAFAWIVSGTAILTGTQQQADDMVIKSTAKCEWPKLREQLESLVKLTQEKKEKNRHRKALCHEWLVRVCWLTCPEFGYRDLRQKLGLAVSQEKSELCKFSEECVANGTIGVRRAILRSKLCDNDMAEVDKNLDKMWELETGGGTPEVRIRNAPEGRSGYEGF